jgi:hypothetical protein
MTTLSLVQAGVDFLLHTLITFHVDGLFSKNWATPANTSFL